MSVRNRRCAVGVTNREVPEFERKEVKDFVFRLLSPRSLAGCWGLPHDRPENIRITERFPWFTWEIDDSSWISSILRSAEEPFLYFTPLL